MREKESMKEGSYIFPKKQIREIFEIETLKDTFFQGTLDSLPKALFAVMKKRN